MFKLFLLLSLMTQLFASESEYEQKLYEKIFPKIFNIQIVRVFIKDRETKKLLEDSLILDKVENCMDADILIGDFLMDKEDICSIKPSFSLSYKSYKRSKNAIGAFYWRKGRPQISFSKDAFKRYHLRIPQSLKKYMQ